VNESGDITIDLEMGALPASSVIKDAMKENRSGK